MNKLIIIAIVAMTWLSSCIVGPPPGPPGMRMHHGYHGGYGGGYGHGHHHGGGGYHGRW